MAAPDSQPLHRAHNFRTTHWSVVLQAGNAASPDSAAALERLCRTYWFPLYAFIRRKGHSEEDAKDLAQAFFAHLLDDHHRLGTVGPEKGKFRSFLLCSLANFLANEWDRRRTLKRGGAIQFMSLDEQDAEERFRIEPVDHLTPERLFERRWAQAVMAQVLARLRTEFDGAGKERRFDALKGFLLGDSTFSSYAEAAGQLGVTEQAIKGAVLRLRRRFGEVLREEIAQTVEQPEAVDEEIRYLLAALRD